MSLALVLEARAPVALPSRSSSSAPRRRARRRPLDRRARVNVPLSPPRRARGHRQRVAYTFEGLQYFLTGGRAALGGGASGDAGEAEGYRHLRLLMVAFFFYMFGLAGMFYLLLPLGLPVRARFERRLGARRRARRLGGRGHRALPRAAAPRCGAFVGACFAGLSARFVVASFARRLWQVDALLAVAGLAAGAGPAFMSLVVRDVPLEAQGKVQGGLYLLQLASGTAAVAAFKAVYDATDTRHAAGTAAARAELLWGACWWLAAAAFLVAALVMERVDVELERLDDEAALEEPPRRPPPGASPPDDGA